MYIPEELLQNIMWELKPSVGSHLKVRDDNSVLYQTLNSCLRASRTLYGLAEPVLYHTINTDNLLTVARHLALKPSLADQVRELSVNERDSHEFVQVMGDTDDQQWPHYLRDRLSAHRSCLYKPNLEDSSKHGYSLAIATFGLIVCTKIHTLVLDSVSSAPQALTAALLGECLALGRARPNDPQVPLGGLREFRIESPTTLSGPEHDFPAGTLGVKALYWFSRLVQLPQIVSVKMGALPLCNLCPQTHTSRLQSLTFVDVDAQRLAHTLGDILRACPMLKSLDVSWQLRYSFHPCLQWAAAVSRHGPNLRKLKLSNSGTCQPPPYFRPSTLVNLASLHHLRSLTLPLEAILSESMGVYSDATYEAVHSGENSEDGYGHAPGVGVNTFTTPLHQLLPCSLRHLRIIDDLNLWADAVRLDKELRNLVLHPHFSKLRSIRVRRKIPWSKHVKVLGWRGTRHGSKWNSLSRPPRVLNVTV